MGGLRQHWGKLALEQKLYTEEAEHFISLWRKGRNQHLDGLGRSFMSASVEFLLGSW